MGNSNSKTDLPPLPKPKEGDIKIDVKNLPKLDNIGSFELPKAPKIMTSSDRKREEEREKLEGLVPFDLKNEFDLGSYTGRFMHQFTRLNPLLFFNSDKTIKECHERVFKYNMRYEAAQRIGSEVMMKPEEIEQLKHDCRVAGGAVHPDTNEIIPFYMRLSGFVLFNVPIACCVIFAPNQSPAFTAFLQWANQTYNAGMNYGNRNASAKQSTNDLAKGYTAACATSIAIAMGSRVAFASTLARLSGPRAVFANSAIGYSSAAFAGVANLMLMRMKELEVGIDVTDETGTEVYGKSIIAGKQAILQTSLSRFVLPAPVLFFPAIFNLVLSSMRLMPKNQPLRNVFELAFCAVSLTVGLPMSVALYQQNSMIPREQLEPEFHEIKDKDGKVVQEFFFNKGL